MKKYVAHVNVMPLAQLLDPQGKATQLALRQIGFEAVEEVRIGKRIKLILKADNIDDAKELAHQASEKLLANMVVEQFEIEVKEAG